MTYPFTLIAGDEFLADCRRPNVREDKSEIQLKGNASCKITKDTHNQPDLDKVKRRYTGCEIIFALNSVIKSYEELNCRYCDCGSKKTKLHEAHTGSDKVKSFIINRIENMPAICARANTKISVYSYAESLRNYQAI